MSSLRSTGQPRTRPESSGAALARSLVIARQIAGITQSRLAAAADVSRATIAQLETGVSDPRLSTIAELARALGLPPALLLLSMSEVEALARLPDEAANHPLSIRPTDIQLMRSYLSSGLVKDRNRAAQVGAEAARAGGHDSDAAATLAALFSTLLPGTGTTIGAALGRLLR